MHGEVAWASGVGVLEPEDVILVSRPSSACGLRELLLDFE